MDARESQNLRGREKNEIKYKRLFLMHFSSNRDSISQYNKCENRMKLDVSRRGNNKKRSHTHTNTYYQTLDSHSTEVVKQILKLLFGRLKKE